MDNTIGKNIQYYRESAKFKKTELARLIPCDVSLITRYEKGERQPTLKILLKVSEIFGLSLDKLVNEDQVDFQLATRGLGKETKEEAQEIVFLKQIAEHIYSNVRALEGSLIRILAYASYNNIDTENISVDIVSEILIDMISDKIKDVNLEKIMQKVCEAYNITPAMIFDKTRKSNISFPRQIAMYLSNLLITQLSLKEIAQYYKRKDHTTVLHAKKTIEEKFKKDNGLRIQIEKLIKEIKR